jgi:hypothetical protein
MPVSFEEILAEMSPERRDSIAKRAAEIEEEIRLRELRHMRKLTQAKLSKKFRIGQEGIFRMEKRADMYISTLRGYVEGVGGKLSLVVEFPDQPPVVLAGLGMGYGEEKPARRKAAAKESPRSKSESTSKSQSGTKSRAKRGAAAAGKVATKIVQTT